ncbi:uncharacterized protein LOC144618313 [Crassostrea virginica]
MIDSESDNEESPQKIRDNNISQKSLAKFVLDNNGVMHVPECEAYIVKGHNEKKYCVTCQCPSMSRCYHILAVRMFVGLPIDDCHSEVSLRSLSKRSLKRSDKKSGRKRPRKNDVDISVTPAPDSLHEEMKKTPKSKKKLRFMSPVEEHPFSPAVDRTSPPSSKFEQSPSPPTKTPPAKKKKVTQVTPVPQKWIHNLTMEHKRKIESGQPLCSDVINTAQKLLKRQFPDISGLQQSERTPVWDEKQNQWKYGIKFEKVNSPAVQIHHNGKFHWVTSIKLDGQIYVMDSLSNGKISPSLQIQLASMYGSDYHQLTVRIPQIQQQTNSVDCGLFAIANAVQFCFSLYQGSDLLKFDEPFLRHHLLHCLEKGAFSPFPRIETKAKLNKKKITYIDVQCDCKCILPNLMQEMIGCDAPFKSCSVWRHRSCAEVEDDDDWYCTPHRH